MGTFGVWFRSGTAALRRRERSAVARHTTPVTPDVVRLALRHALRDRCDAALRDDSAVRDPAAFDTAVRQLAASLPFPVHVTVDDVPLTPAVASAAYAVICEALANVVGHAEARRAIVTVRRHGPTVQLSVTDDGSGGAQPVIGGGIVVLAARVAALGGMLHVDSPPGSGTHVTVELPYTTRER